MLPNQFLIYIYYINIINQNQDQNKLKIAPFLYMWGKTEDTEGVQWQCIACYVLSNGPVPSVARLMLLLLCC